MRYRRKAIATNPPYHITIGISSACNNKCLFCSYHGEDAKDKSNVYNLPFMLSIDEFKRIADMAYRGGGAAYPYMRNRGTVSKSQYFRNVRLCNRFIWEGFFSDKFLETTV